MWETPVCGKYQSVGKDPFTDLNSILPLEQSDHMGLKLHLLLPTCPIG